MRKGRLVGLIGFVTLMVFSAGLFIRMARFQSRLDYPRSISMMVDWLDIEIFKQKENRAVISQLSDLKEAGVQVIAVPLFLNTKIEALLRSKNFTLVWRTAYDVQADVLNKLTRLQKGDGLVTEGESFLGYPRQLRDVARVLEDKGAFLPLVEFAPQAGKERVTSMLKSGLVLAHCLQAKERVKEQPGLWLNRFERAAKERFVQMFYVQFGPSQTWDENIRFLKSLSQHMTQRGYTWGRVDPVPVSPFLKFTPRLGFVTVLAFCMPLLVVYLAVRLRFHSALVGFLFCVMLSLSGGMIAYSAGYALETIIGLDKIKGIKVLLVGPLVAGLPLVMSRSELNQILKKPVTGWQLAMVSVFGLLFVGIYLMRSGNFPLIPVADGERFFRDALENFFGVRPRFKEFLIGHPLLILGLFLRGANEFKVGKFLTDGRLFIWLGMVGQISIMNTFLHFKTPILMEIMRTLHGAWLGILFSFPVCHLVTKRRLESFYASA